MATINLLQANRQLKHLNMYSLALTTQAQQENGMLMYRLAMNGGVPRSTIATIPLSETVTLATIYGVCEGFQITLQEFFNSPLFDKD